MYTIYSAYYMTCSSPISPLFLHALSIEWITKLCINLLNQFSVHFHIEIVHDTIWSFNCVNLYGYLVDLRTVLWLLND